MAGNKTGSIQVFISYSYNYDKKVADGMCKYLESRGIQCWYAPRDIKSGEKWEDAIMAAIKASQYVVLIFSKNSNNSDHVKNEIAAAFNAGCTVIPFKIDSIEASEGLAYYLNRVQSMDAFTPPIKARYKALYENIVGEPLEPQHPEPKPPKPGASSSSSGPHMSGKNFKAIVIALGILVVLVAIFLSVLSGVRFLQGNSSANIVSSEAAEETEGGDGNENDAYIEGTSDEIAREETGLISDSLSKLLSDGMDVSEMQYCSVLGSDITREEVYEITFLDSLQSAASDAWDVSAMQDGSYLAWVIKDGDGYELFIAADGGVTAPSDCSYLFAGYINLESIKFNGICSPPPAERRTVLVKT